MRILRKITETLLIFMLIFQGCIVSSNVYATQEKDYNNEAVLLKNLGIISKFSLDDFKKNTTVTRAQFASIATLVLGYEIENLPNVTTQTYIDVPLDYWAVKEIYQLYKLNIMTGKDDATFSPDENITYNEAVKIFVSILGYNTIALEKGGFPSGYNAVASNIGITKGVNPFENGLITLGELSVLIVNSLETKVLDQVGFGDDTSYNKAEKTLMQTTLNVYCDIGILNGYDDTCLEGASVSCPQGRYLLSGELYYANDNDVSQYLGMKVKVYYKKDVSTEYKMTVFISDKLNYNTVHTIYDEYISTKTTTSKFEYFTDKENKSSVKTFKINENAIFIYNNKRLAVVSNADLMPLNGEVKLIDNNNDNSYDVVIIKDYQQYVVENIVETSKLVKTQYGKEDLDFSDENTNIKVKYYLKDEETDFSAIGKYNVINVLKSKNIGGVVLYSVYISQDSVTDVISEFGVYNMESVITLSDGKKYILSKEYVNMINKKAPKANLPKVGDTYTIYLDTFGKVSYINKTTIKNYGYLVGCRNDGNSVDNYSEFKIFTKNGEFVTYKGKPKILYGGDIKLAEDVVNILKDEEGKTIYQLIIYEVDKDNLVTQIRTAEDKTAEKFYEATENEFILNCIPKNKNGEPSGLRFYKNLAENKPYSYVNSKTLQFKIPKDKTKESEYRVVTKLSGTDVGVAAPIAIYDAAAGGTIGAIVTGTSADGKFGTPVIIDKIADSIDENGETCQKLYFFGGSSVLVDPDKIIYSQPPTSDSKGGNNWQTKVPSYKYLTLKDLQMGDVITYTTIDGKLDMLRVLVDVTDIGPIRSDGDHIAESGNMVAKVLSTSEDGTYAILDTQNRFGENFAQTMNLNSTVYLWDSQEMKVKYSSKNDIEVGDTILINSFWWSAKMIVIFR